MWRDISWLKRAENEIDDNDAKFIFLWISFNDTYTSLESAENKLESLLSLLFIDPRGHSCR